MAGTKRANPEGFSAVTPHIAIKGAREALEFYKKAFGAEERFMLPGPDGRVMHAEMTIGGSIVMLAEEYSECPGPRSPQTLGGTTFSLHLYFENVDEAFDRAVKAGAEVTMPLENMFWGDRYGRIRDPFGHEWSLAQHISDPTPEEMQAAMNAMMSGSPA